jgi:hypothetical protein
VCFSLPAGEGGVRVKNKNPFIHSGTKEFLRGTTRFVKRDIISFYLFVAITGVPVADYLVKLAT